MKNSKSNALPPMAFGQDVAVVHADSRQFGNLIESVFPGLNAYDPKTDAASFRSQTTVLSMETSQVLATSVSPTVVDRKNNPRLTFLVPFGGDPECSSQVGSEKLAWGLGRGGIFLPSCEERVIGAGGFRSQVMWQVEREKLQSTARAMLGETNEVNLQLDRFRLLPLEVAGVRTDASMQSLLPLFQLYRRSPDILSQLGVEDLLYRHSVMLLRPDLFEKSNLSQSSSVDDVRQRRLLDPLCEYIMGHLSDSLTLTDLEAISGMSARSLQLAFNARFGITPMAWIREARLLRVRSLLQSKMDTPIESVALAAGFHTMPAFFKAYKERFGETPGQTKSRN